MESLSSVIRKVSDFQIQNIYIRFLICMDKIKREREIKEDFAQSTVPRVKLNLLLELYLSYEGLGL